MDNPKRKFTPAGILGAVAGFAFSRYAGSNVLVPIVGAVLIGWTIKKIKREQYPMGSAVAVQGGHCLWMIVAAVVGVAGRNRNLRGCHRVALLPAAPPRRHLARHVPGDRAGRESQRNQGGAAGQHRCQGAVGSHRAPSHWHRRDGVGAARIREGSGRCRTCRQTVDRLSGTRGVMLRGP